MELPIISLLLWLLALVTLAIISAVSFYVYMTRNFDYWKQLGVPYIKPLPFLGNFGEIATFRILPPYVFKKLYDLVDAPYIGLFMFDYPVLMLKSPRLINNIMTTDSCLFINRSTADPDHNQTNDYLMFFQRGKKWKQARSNIGPVFSTLKQKSMFGIIEAVTNRFSENICKDGIIDLNNVFSLYSSDVIARVFYGLLTNCSKNEDNEFFKNIKKLFAFSWTKTFKLFVVFFKPEMINLIRVDFTENSALQYFNNLLSQSWKNRKQPDKKFQDFVDILKEMEEKKEQKGEKMTTEDLDEAFGSAFSFLLAGSLTIASTLSFTLYEFTRNEEIQIKARNEVKKLIQKYGKITYEAVQNAKFLDMCILETIRRYPILPHICRQPSEDYTFAETGLTIKKGTRIYIPLYSLHMDEKYFPNPKEYNPNRFQDFQKSEGELFFLPFGGGFRTCIGKRFGIIVVKVALMHLLLNFKLEKCPSTPKRIEFVVRSLALKSKRGLNVKISPLDAEQKSHE